MKPIMDITQFLAECKCSQYVGAFLENEISMELVPELDSQALRDLGVKKVGDRLRLEIAIAEMRERQFCDSVSVEELQRALHKEQPQGSNLADDLTVVPVASKEPVQRIVTFILPDGLMKKINVEGCFNAQLVKRKVLKKLGVKGRDHEYGTYVHTTGPNGAKITSLYDVEFVAVCFSPERTEKHRIMLTPNNELPTPAAAEQSLRIMQRLAGRKQAVQPAMRNFFGQRPPLELISLNLGEYFPHAPQQELEKTVRNSVRYSVRALRRLPGNLLIFSLLLSRKTVGDMFMHNNLDSETVSVASGETHRFSVATGNNRYSRIELLSVDSDEDHVDECLDFYSDPGMAPFTPGKKWVQGARIGSGSFGTVVLGMDPLTGELMAVKQVPMPPENAKSLDPQRLMVEALHHEMALLKDLNHENIVRYFGSLLEGDFLNIFLEYVPGGSVHLMLQLYGPFEEPLIRNFIRQVLVGLSYLHGMDIIHRDIKGANILIDIKGTVKISDFGISKKIDSAETEGNKQARRALLQGSVYWMAPEVVKQTAYTKKADVWSVGCLIVEMFTGRHPYPSFSQMQAIFKIGTHTQPLIPQWCTAEGKDFLGRTFEIDHEKRPSADDLLRDSFMNPLILQQERQQQHERKQHERKQLERKLERQQEKLEPEKLEKLEKEKLEKTEKQQEKS